MPYPQLDRSKLKIALLKERKNKVHIDRDHVDPEGRPTKLNSEANTIIGEIVGRIREARKKGRPVMLALGAHAIKNGLAPVLIKLMEEGWLTHLATNGAGIIHDWEFAFQGASSEDVKANVAQGRFGIWQETGFFINLALIAGAYEGMGYGESIGSLIEREGLQIPSPEKLKREAGEGKDLEKAAAALDLASVIQTHRLKPGWLAVPHLFKKFSVQAAAFRLKIPFTGHPMIGHDIIYNHPMNHGAALGRAAQRDFLTFAHGVHQLEGGVYLSVGSAVMSPMIFEKSLSMAQNLEMQAGRHIDGHFMAVVDLARSAWNWEKDGEPPADNPAYYLRFCKTFSRMGGEFRYVSADNRDFLLALCQGLAGRG